MGQQIIYVDGLGFIPIVSGQTPQDAIAAAQSKRGTLGVSNPMNPDQSVGVSLPPMPGDAASDALDAIPQMAGLAAQFTPIGRGLKGATAIPAIAEAVMQMIRGEGFDPVAIGAQGSGGAISRGVGAGVEKIGQGGKSMILRSLGLQGPLKNEVAEEMLPNLVLRENAKMTKPGVQAIRDKAKATGAGGLEELGEAMGAARLNAATDSSRITGWPHEMVANFIRRPPRVMAIGKALTEPFGVNTSETLAPAVEAIMRLLMGSVAAETDTPVTGPRRRQRAQQ